jgi:hypothetical protein
MKEQATTVASLILEHATRSRVCDAYKRQRQMQRLSLESSRDIAVFAVQCLSGCSEQVQHASFEKLLSRPLLKRMVPPHLRCLEIVKLNHLVVSNIKDGMREHLVGNRQSKAVLAKDIVCAFASSGSLLTSTKGVALVLGVDRRNIWRGIDRKTILDTT